jgi:hypothetical protein
MSAIRVPLFLLALVCVAVATGCRSMRPIPWDLSSRESEPREQWYDPTAVVRDQDDNIRWLTDARAKNEAAYLARNPGARPGSR